MDTAPLDNSWADKLGIVQTADCITTDRILKNGGYERDPIAIAIGATRSLPMCMLDASVINLAFRFFDHSKGHVVTQVFAGLEVIAVGNNARVILSWRTK